MKWRGVTMKLALKRQKCWEGTREWEDLLQVRKKSNIFEVFFLEINFGFICWSYTIVGSFQFRYFPNHRGTIENMERFARVNQARSHLGCFSEWISTNSQKSGEKVRNSIPKYYFFKPQKKYFYESIYFSFRNSTVSMSLLTHFTPKPYVIPRVKP